MTSALFPNQRASAVGGSSARWLELVFLWILLPGQGCHSDFPYCPVPAAVCHTAGALEEDLCFCNPATGVLPPPRCYLMIQSGRWQPVGPVEANLPEPTEDAGRAVATDSPFPQPVERPKHERRPLFANFWPAPRTMAAEPVRPEPRRPQFDDREILAELGPRRSGPSRNDLVPPPALPPAPLAVHDALPTPIRADLRGGLQAEPNIEPHVTSQAEPSVPKMAPSLAAAPRPVATVPISIASDMVAIATDAPETFTPSAPLPVTITPQVPAANQGGATPVAPLYATPAHESPRPRDLLPAAPRPEPLRIAAAIQPADGDSDKPAAGAPLPIQAPHAVAPAEPVLRPAPRPAVLNIIDDRPPFAHADEAGSNAHQSTTSRNDRPRRNAGPLQEWEAS